MEFYPPSAPAQKLLSRAGGGGEWPFWAAKEGGKDDGGEEWCASYEGREGGKEG